jgi:hypothetical protein
MKVPTDATKVFSPRAVTEPVSLNTVDLGIVSDLIFNRQELSAVKSIAALDRLRGMGQYVVTSSTAAEASTGNGTFGAGQTSVTWPAFNSTSTATIDWIFRRAPSFFDIVCYLGTGVTTNFTHNLGVVPEMLITKKRSNTGPWVVYTAMTGNTDYLQLYTADAVQTNTDYYNSTTPTSSVFTLGSSTSTNTSSQTYVAYLFATCAGVSKVGSYTGTGTTNQINCGFTSGARFVMIKRTDNYNLAVGDWYVWDSARGIIAGNDPYLLMNSTAAEVTSTDYVDAYSAGFEISSTAPNALNQSGANYIFLAIA